MAFLALDLSAQEGVECPLRLGSSVYPLGMAADIRRESVAYCLPVVIPGTSTAGIMHSHVSEQDRRRQSSVNANAV